MLSISSAQQAAISSKARAEHIKVSVKQGATWYDLTDLEGYNWVKSVSVSDDIDSNMMSANVVLIRENDYLSLATLMQASKINQYTGSYDALIDYNTQIKIEVAVTGELLPVTSGEWINIFEGYIVTPRFGGDTKKNEMTINCLDNGVALQNNFIETERVYSTSSGTAVQTVMQSILTDNSTGVTLYVPTSPGWNIKQYIQRKEPVLSALQKLAGQIGWLVKYRWDSGTSAWRLTLYKPSAAHYPSAGALSLDHTFYDYEYTNVGATEINGKNIRNKVVVVYTDLSGPDPVRSTVTRSDATSITKYGTRYCEIAESSTSEIDTSTEATYLGDNVLIDLKDPVINHTISMPLYPFSETGDYYKFVANNIHYDNDQSLGLRSYVHNWTNGTGTTEMRCHGTPAGGYTRWLNIEARQGIAPSADFKGTVKPFEISNYTKDLGITAYNKDANSELNSLLQNGDFAHQSRDVVDFEPDGWSVTTGTWGSSSDVYIDSGSATGTRSLHFRNTATASVIVESAFVPVTEGDIYSITGIAKGDSSDGSDAHIIEKVYYQANKTTVVSTITQSSKRYTTGTWVTTVNVNPNFIVPANARWAKIKITKTTSTPHNLYFDRLNFTRTKGTGVGSSTSTQNISASTDTTVDFATNGSGVGAYSFPYDPIDFDTTNDYFECANTGIYLLTASVRLLDVENNKYCALWFDRDTGGGWTQLSEKFIVTSMTNNGGDNDITLTAIYTGYVLDGAKIRLRIRHDSAAAKDIDDMYFYVTQISWA